MPCPRRIQLFLSVSLSDLVATTDIDMFRQLLSVLFFCHVCLSVDSHKFPDKTDCNPFIDRLTGRLQGKLCIPTVYNHRTFVLALIAYRECKHFLNPVSQF